jgi:hypothetical protein
MKRLNFLTGLPSLNQIQYSIPHQFTGKEDIEIAGFLAATIAWGNRKMILRNANRINEYYGQLPL